MDAPVEPRILDCTLRDGSYSVQFQFTADDTYRIVRGLDRAGVPLIEVGHGLGLNAQNDGWGAAAASDREYLDAAVAASEEAAVGSFYIPGIGRPADVEMVADTGADFVRIGQNITEWTETREAIETAVDHDLTVCGNLMKSYAVTPETAAERCSDLEQWGADVVYLVDSAGGMLPENVEEYVGEAVAVLDGAAVGFHCHDNLDLAVANTLTAIDAGARWVDATLQKIGRSAGNARLETLATVLEKQGYALDIDQKGLMDLGEQEISPLLAGGGVDPVDITAGYALFHTAFLEKVSEVAEEYALDVRDLIVAVSKVDLVDLSYDTISETAETLAASDDTTTLERRTSYLSHSRPIEQGTDAAEDRSPESFARRVDRTARKYGKTSVLSVTPAFEEISNPRPTVLHRSDQAILGNIQVTDEKQAGEVLDAVDNCVDTLAVDVAYSNTTDGGAESRVVSFDDRLAVARAIAYFVDETVDTTDPNIAVIGSHPVVESVLNVFNNRNWLVSLYSGTSGHERRSCVTVVDTVDTAVADANVLVAFSHRDDPSVDDDIVAKLPSECTLLDAGIRSISRDAIEFATDRDLDVYRSDTRAGYISEIECALITRELFDTVLGSRRIDGTQIVAGGVIGDRGDVVVDAVQDPDHVFGIADGVGGLKESLSSEERERMVSITRRFGATKESY
mgnify:CR=1 FL=1